MDVLDAAHSLSPPLHFCSSDKALSEAQDSLNKIRSELLAWQSQYSDVRKEMKELQGTSDTLRVGHIHAVNKYVRRV